MPALRPAAPPGAPGFCLVALGKVRRICLARIMRAQDFCAKRTVGSYASVVVGRRRRRWRNRQFGRFRVMTLAVYFSYFESRVGYRNALRSRLGTYKGLELQRSGVSKDFVCIGRWACRRHPNIESLPTL